MDTEHIIKQAQIVNMRIKELSVNTKLKPRKRISKDKKIFSVKKEANVMIKRGEQMNIEKLESSINVIESYLNGFRNKDNSNLISEKLKHFLKFRKESDTNKKIYKSKISHDVLRGILESQKEKSFSIREILCAYRKKVNSEAVSEKQIKRYIKQILGYKYKNVLFEHIKTCEINHYIQKYLYIIKISQLIKSNQTILFIDETNFAQKKLRIRRWVNSKFSKCIKNRGRTRCVNVIGTISILKPLLFHYNSYANDSDSIIQYLKDLEEYLRQDLNFKMELEQGNITIVWDNCKIHASSKTVKFLKNIKFKTLFQPTYCPSVNSIEFIWAFIKRQLGKVNVLDE